jgi:hypothetical protein
VLPEAKQDPADEVTTVRAFYERWLEDHNGRTAVGLCGVPQRRWRGVIRFLESYSRGEAADMQERPADVPVPQFIRYCVDDLKAFYYEARMAQRPTASESEIHRWFWGETAVAQLIRAVAQRMTASEDAALKYFAYGLSR